MRQINFRMIRNFTVVPSPLAVIIIHIDDTDECSNYRHKGFIIAIYE